MSRSCKLGGTDRGRATDHVLSPTALANLPDAADDHLIELAVAAGASTIITSNVRDVARGELVFDGLSVRTPARYLQERAP